MATIKIREGKTGTSYLIRSSCGYDTLGNQVVRSTTWKPTPGMTKRQIEKELSRQAVLFDEKCAAQGVGNGNVKFETFAQQWFTEYAETNNRPRTIERLHQMEKRVYQGIGHIRLDKLTARHIQTFINNLSEEGISERTNYATPKRPFLEELTERGLTRKALAAKSGVSASTISSLCKGERITTKTADKLAAALEVKAKDLFTIQKNKESLSPKTIKLYLSFISSVLDYALRFDMIPANPCKKVVLPSPEKKEKAVYTLEEAQHFLDSLEQAPIKYKAFFVLAIYGGLRRGELLGLEWSDIDFKDHVIHIRRTSQYLKGQGTYTDDTKTDKSTRTLKLPTVVFDVLRQHRAAQAEDRLALGDRWQNSGRLFTTLEGAPMHPNTTYHWLLRFCEETGQRFLGIHAFRHLNASLLINSGVDVRTVSASLGHSQTTTTLNIYAHTFAESQARASEAVGDLLARAK